MPSVGGGGGGKGGGDGGASGVTGTRSTSFSPAAASSCACQHAASPSQLLHHGCLCGMMQRLGAHLDRCLGSHRRRERSRSGHHPARGAGRSRQQPAATGAPQSLAPIIVCWRMTGAITALWCCADGFAGQGRSAGIVRTPVIVLVRAGRFVSMDSSCTAVSGGPLVLTCDAERALAARARR